MRSVIDEVESEYGQPFWEVVQGYADDGYSIHATADILGYASDTPFRRLIKRHGVDIKFASAQESLFQIEAREARRGKCTDAQREACKAASAQNPVYIFLDYQGVRDTLTGHCKRIGLSVSTARKRYRVNPCPEYVFARKSYVKTPVAMGWNSPEGRQRLRNAMEAG